MPNTHDTSGAAWQNTAGSIAVDSHNTVWVAGFSGGFPCYWSADCNGSDAANATAHTNAISALSPAASIMTNNSSSVIGGGATAIMLNSAGTGLGYIFGYAQPVSADSSVVRPFFYTYTSGSTEGVTFCTVPDGCTLDTAPSNGGLMFNDGSTYTLNGTMLTSAVFGIVNLNKSGIIVPCFWLLGAESSGHPID